MSEEITGWVCVTMVLCLLITSIRSCGLPTQQAECYKLTQQKECFK